MIIGLLKNKFLWCFLGFLFLVCMLPTFSNVFFFQMPGKSDDFDCDDAVLLMHDRLSISGIDSDIMAGNMNYSGEEFKDIDHVWLLVHLLGVKIPLDWGIPNFGKQHYEGYVVDRVQLVQWVNADVTGRVTTGAQYEPAIGNSP